MKNNGHFGQLEPENKVLSLSNVCSVIVALCSGQSVDPVYPSLPNNDAVSADTQR